MNARQRSKTAVRGRRLAVAAGAMCLLFAGACLPEGAVQEPRLVLFVGVDVSGSFQNTGNYDDALRFTAHYIYGHLENLGDLEEPAVLFVGSIGGERPGQPKSFHPVHDFQGKTVDEIDADLRTWFEPDDAFTDFNVFFDRVADFVQRQNLTLKPITILVVSDGIPDVTSQTDISDPYRTINLDPLEYLSRNVTVRLIYPNPEVAVRWEQEVTRRRVRMWTVDDEVMAGWRSQVTLGLPVERQDLLWQWISENVDFRVRRSVL